MKQKDNPTRRLAITSALLVLLAFVSVAASTTAWMTIADRTRVRSMRMEITSGPNLRFDLDPHQEFEDYVKSLTFAQISRRIAKDQGYDPKETPLSPVTTDDCVHFTLEDGSPAKTGDYLEFILHFMAMEDMVVHLTSADSTQGGDGTLVSSEAEGLPPALRISFTAEETSIYHPGMGNSSEATPMGRLFGLPAGDKMEYHAGNALFSLKKGVDKAVTVRIWLEGTDENCTDEVRDAEFQIQLRFAGTDEKGNLLEDSRNIRQAS